MWIIILWGCTVDVNKNQCIHCACKYRCETIDIDYNLDYVCYKKCVSEIK